MEDREHFLPHAQPPVDEATLRAQFNLVEIDDEGILLNRESGAVYLVNRSACEIWGALFRGLPVSEIVDQMVRRFALNRQEAEKDVSATLGAHPAAPASPVTSQFRWCNAGDGYASFEGESSLWHVSAGANTMRLHRGLELTPQQIWFRLKAVVPKLLALRGIRVLHASAVDCGEALLVFTGPSGAGKTTTARAFAAAGGALVSEDLLVVDTSDGPPSARMEGEPAIRRWVTEWASALGVDPDQTVDCTQLDRCNQGDRTTIRSIYFIDAERRMGQTMQSQKLSRADGFVALLDSSFFASVEPNDWQMQLRVLREIVHGVPTARLTMPQGLDHLGEAVKAVYREITAS